jgi:hypothetical protein
MKQYTMGADRIVLPGQSIIMQQTEAVVISTKKSNHADGYPCYVGVDVNYSLWGVVNQHQNTGEALSDCMVLLTNRPRSGTIRGVSVKVQTRDLSTAINLPVVYPSFYLWVTNTAGYTVVSNISVASPATPAGSIAAYRGTRYTLGVSPTVAIPFTSSDMLLLRMQGETLDIAGPSVMHASSFYDLTVTFDSTEANPIIF